MRRKGGRRGSRGSPKGGSRRFPERLPVPPRRGILPERPRERTTEPRRRPGPERSRGPPPRAGSMPRGRAWTPAEVINLLSLVRGSGGAALLMASTSRPNQALWQKISRRLAVAGYERSVAQCRAKWKSLKQAFHSERETLRTTGHHSSRLPPHYRTMKSIWKAAGRPVFGERRMPKPNIGGNTSITLLSPVLQCTKDEPESPGGENIAGVPPTSPAMPHTSCCVSPLSLLDCHADLKQEGAEGKANFSGETSLGTGRGSQVLPLAAATTGSHRTAVMSEQPAAAEDTSDASLHGSGVAGLLQNVQQLLVQILQTSQQQQALLEILARDTVTHLHVLSHRLVQVGETLQQLLLQPQTHPGLLGHCVPHMPLFEGGSRVPCSPGTPHTSLDHKEEPQLSYDDARCISP